MLKLHDCAMGDRVIARLRLTHALKHARNQNSSRSTEADTVELNFDTW